MWGQHLIVDLGGCDRAAVASEAAIRAFAAELVGRIGMRAHGPPTIAYFAAHDPKASGHTLVQLIETSSITAHFAEKCGEVYLDVFSCRPFANADVVAVCRAHFAPRTVNLTCLARHAGRDPRRLSPAA